jgi:hypothetical protein
MHKAIGLVVGLLMIVGTALSAQAPTIATINPSSGPDTGGTVVTITGTNFEQAGGVSVVTFGGTPGTDLDVISDTELEVTTPAGTAGDVDVVVTNGDGPATEVDGFTYLAVPTITNIAPSMGPLAAGTLVTITGTNFQAAGNVNSVTFGGDGGTGLNILSDTELEINAPAGTAGAVDVVVTNGDGSGTATNGYTYVAAPTIATITPSAGPVAGGTSVTITGTNFVGVTAVNFDGNPGTSLTVNSPTELTIETPAGTAGAVNVQVVAAGGSVTETGGFTYAAAPTITNINPASGFVAGGTVVTITGTNFIGVTAVNFDGNPGTSLNVNSDTELTIETPAGAAGDVNVQVVAAGGSVTETDGFEYIAPANSPPVINVTQDGNAVTSGTPINVINGTTLASLLMVVTVTDVDNDNLTLTAAITGVAAGLVQAEWEDGPTAGTDITLNLNAATGTFNTNGTVTVTLTADDNVNPVVTFIVQFEVVAAPTITVTAPNGGETWLIGQQATVTWNSAGVTGNVDIQLSLDGGANFTVNLAMNTANDGTENITVPANATLQARVRVRSVADNSVFGASAANFTIENPPPGSVTLAAQNNPGAQSANPGSTRTALGFRLTETGGSSAFSVNTVVVTIDTINNIGNVAINSIASVSLMRGSSQVASVTNGGAGWGTLGDVVTVTFSGLNQTVSANQTQNFSIRISFGSGTIAAPNPIYQANLAVSGINGGTDVTGSAVTGGQITLSERLPDDPFADDKDDSSCDLSVRSGPAWPVLLFGAFAVLLAVRRRSIARQGN